MRNPLRLLIADDHAVVREGLRMFLTEEPDIEVVGEASNGEEATALAARLRPDVVLMDLTMPVLDGIEATRRIRADCPNTQVLVLTSFADDRRVLESVQAGAVGYLMKDVLKPELLRAIHDAAQNKPTLHPQAQRLLMQQVVSPTPVSPFQDLTERERDVLRLIAQGQSNKQIAAALGLTEGTIKGYVSAILLKLEVADRTQAALFAVKNGLE